MRAALVLAAAAAAAGEVPVGAIVVDASGAVVASASNSTESLQSPLAHAELLAIQFAAARLGGWRLAGCTLYVTLEPCPMCAGAALNARLKRIVYGAPSPRVGADGGWVRLLPPYTPAPVGVNTAAVAVAAESAAELAERTDGMVAARRCAGACSSGGTCDGGSGGNASASAVDNTAASEAEAAALKEGTVAGPPSLAPHPFHPDMQVTRGVLAAECAAVLRDFFRRRRAESGGAGGSGGGGGQQDSGSWMCKV
jgi:tRNA(adenine34) deaminase